MFDRVHRRLVLANVLVIASILVALGAGIIVVMDRFLVDQATASLRDRAGEIVERLRADPGDLGLQPAGPLPGIFAAAWDSTGKLVLDPASIGAPALQAAAAAATHDGTDAVVATRAGDAIVVSYQVTGGVLQIGQEIGPVREVEGQVTLLLAIAGVVGLVLAVVAGWLLAGRAMRPIEVAFSRQLEFTADASHELRTPLAVVDAGLQVIGRHPDQPVAAQAETLAAMRSQVDRMNRLVGGLLTLARADAGASELHLAATDLDALLRRTVAGFGPLAATRGASVEVVAASAGLATVDPDRIAELLDILVDNAVRHAGEGVHVRVSAARTAGGVEIVVADDGPGIPATERERVTERFVRGDESRSGDGTGLGLAIARWVAEAHGGRLQLEDAAPGLRVRVRLPGGIAGPSATGQPIEAGPAQGRDLDVR